MTANIQQTMKTIAGATVVTMLMVTTASAQFVVGPSVEYGAISRPSGMASGDFNGDGAVDLATTADAVDRIVVFQNAGDGTFGTTLDFLLPNSSSPQDVIAGDFDGDLDLDLAVALRDPGGLVQIMINNGTGLFSLGPSIGVGDRPRGLSIGDFDGDLDLDIAVANRNSDTMSILTNNGSGLFASASVAVGVEPRHTAFGNFLPDAGLEIAVTNHDSRTVTILDESGGLFSPVMTLSVGPVVRPDGIVAADFDGNGVDDLAVAAGEPSVATVFMNNGAGFNSPLSYPTGGVNSSEMMAADLNCNGSLDLVVTNSDSNNVSLLANNGNGTFGIAQLIATGLEPGEGTVGDWDGDLDFDIAVANKSSNNISALINHTCTITTGDFNGDGIFDGTDVDALVEEIVAGSNMGNFDMTGDGLVDRMDLTEWLAVAGEANLASGNSYLEGDANLDGTVDGLDFIDWNENRFAVAAAWSLGDFNADGFVDASDFIIWNDNKFTSADSFAAVPEPALPCMWVLLGLFVASKRRNR
jgi:hypothetical protein